MIKNRENKQHCNNENKTFYDLHVNMLVFERRHDVRNQSIKFKNWKYVL